MFELLNDIHNGVYVIKNKFNHIVSKDYGMVYGVIKRSILGFMVGIPGKYCGLGDTMGFALIILPVSFVTDLTSFK